MSIKIVGKFLLTSKLFYRRNVEQETDEMQLLEINDTSRETVSAEIKTSKLRLNLWLAKKCAAMKRMSSIVAGNLKLFAKFVNPSSFIIVCYEGLFFLEIKSFVW